MRHLCQVLTVKTYRFQRIKDVLGTRTSRWCLVKMLHNNTDYVSTKKKQGLLFVLCRTGWMPPWLFNYLCVWRGPPPSRYVFHHLLDLSHPLLAIAKATDPTFFRHIISYARGRSLTETLPIKWSLIDMKRRALLPLSLKKKTVNVDMTLGICF